MKKWLVGISTAALLILPQGSIFAATSSNIPVSFNKVNIVVNGQAAASNNILYDGSTYVPIRNIAVMQKLPVTFYPNENIVNIGFVPAGQQEPGVPSPQTDNSNDDVQEEKRDTEIDAVFDAITIMVNLQKVEASNLLYNGRTYVPLRAVSDILGLNVAYDDATATAYIGAIPKEEPTKTSDSTKSKSPAAAKSGMYHVPAQGEMAGWMMLKGHPYEDMTEIYYQVNGSMVTTKVKDIRTINLDEVITWVDDDGRTVRSTRRDIHRLIGSFSNQYTSSWFTAKFGDVYADYLRVSALHVENLVDQYLKETGQIELSKSQVTLKPDTVLVPRTGYDKFADGTIVFYAYDRSGTKKGTYMDADDINYGKKNPEPPKLSDKWMSLSILKKIYDVSYQDTQIVIKQGAEEVLRLPLPSNWNQIDVTETTSSNIRIKKFNTGPDKQITETWIDEKTLEEKTGVRFRFAGNTVDDYAFYGPYKSPTEYTTLLELRFPSSWNGSPMKDAIEIKGLHIKKESGKHYFLVEDLLKLKIITLTVEKESKDFTMYFNVDDLTAAGLLK